MTFKWTKLKSNLNQTRARKKEIKPNLNNHFNDLIYFKLGLTWLDYLIKLHKVWLDLVHLQPYGLQPGHAWFDMVHVLLGLKHDLSWVGLCAAWPIATSTVKNGTNEK